MEHPESGRRPVCVVTRQAAIEVLHSVVVAPASRRIRWIPTEVRLDEADGMPEPCALSLDSLATVSKALLTSRISRLSPVRLAELCLALRRSTDC
jgi:mRNA interferase MazF